MLVTGFRCPQIQYITKESSSNEGIKQSHLEGAPLTWCSHHPRSNHQTFPGPPGMFEVWKPPGWEVTVTDGEEEQVVSNSQESFGGAVKERHGRKTLQMFIQMVFLFSFNSNFMICQCVLFVKFLCQ